MVIWLSVALLTLIGYHFGNIDNNSADAQITIRSPETEIVDEIRCRRLVIVGENDTPRITLGTNFLDRGKIEIFNEDGERRILFGVIASDFDTGGLQIYGKESGGAAVMLGMDHNGGFMALFNKVLKKPVFQAGITNKGDGFAITFDKTGAHTDAIGPKGNTGFVGKRRSRN